MSGYYANANANGAWQVAKRISVINFKGGVGKTTLAFNFAAGLSRFHDSRVLLVDMDHQSSLSIVCLGSRRWQQVAEEGATINRVFSEFGADLPGREVVHQADIAHHSNIDVVPAQLDLDDTEVELTASHQGNAIRSEWNKRTLLCRWIEETGVDDEYDYVLFDCAPATKIISQNAIAASHGYIVPVVPEAVMERGAPHLRNMVRSGIDERLKALASLGSPRLAWVPDTQLVGLAITRIQVAGNALSGYTNEHTAHLQSMQRQWGDDLLEPYIFQGTGVTEALSDRVPVYSRPGTQNIGYRGIDVQYRHLTERLKTKIDSL